MESKINSMKNFSDEPITDIGQDKYGFDKFAEMIANCISGLDASVGSTIAINGIWGSGKSSVVNLVRNHLGKKENDLRIISFQCWMYRSEDALSLGFVREIYARISDTLPNGSGFNSKFRKLATQVATAGNILGPALSATMIPGLGSAVSSASVIMKDFFESTEDPETLQREIAEELEKSGKKFLIIIDDIDRLTPK